MPSSVTAPLYTTVRNTTSQERTYSYLGKHGKKLAAGGEYTVFGHIQHSFGHGEIAERKRKALLRDLDAVPPRLAIIETPQTLVYEATLAAALANPSVQATVAVNGGNTVANPTTQATVAATGGGSSGGNLPAGNYFVAYSWVAATGETTVGTSVSASVTVSSGNIPRVTIPALPTGAVSANIYLSDTGGTNTALHLYKTGVTTTTADLSAATWNNGTQAFAAAPDKPATNSTGGGTLPAGTYYVAYSWVTQNGETTIGTSRSAQFTVVLGNIPRVTIASLPAGVVGANIYLTQANGASGTETLYARGVTATTKDLTVPHTTGQAAIPAANTAQGGYSRLIDLSSGALGVVAPGWFPAYPV